MKKEKPVVIQIGAPYKQRKRSKVGTGHNAIDSYKELDEFIPEAGRIANEEVTDRSLLNYNQLWSTCFCNAMNKILHEEGLRVL